MIRDEQQQTPDRYCQQRDAAATRLEAVGASHLGSGGYDTMRHEFVSIILMNDFAYVKHVMFVGLTFCIFFLGVGSWSCSDTSRGDFQISLWIGSAAAGLGGTRYGHCMG